MKFGANISCLLHRSMFEQAWIKEWQFFIKKFFVFLVRLFSSCFGITRAALFV